MAKKEPSYMFASEIRGYSFSHYTISRESVENLTDLKILGLYSWLNYAKFYGIQINSTVIKDKFNLDDNELIELLVSMQDNDLVELDIDNNCIKGVKLL